MIYDIVARLVHVKGLVQGIGFRPFIFKLAKKNLLQGWIHNLNDAVEIKIEGERTHIEFFLSTLRSNPLPIADIENIEVLKADVENLQGFEILDSSDRSDSITRVSPDLAICDACLLDMKQQPRRKNYPFTNCTYCGPRFSIVRDLPYDRIRTTMSVFEMCPDCSREYHDIYDRRFHAQPIACNDCGPVYQWADKDPQDIEEIIDKTVEMIDGGRIVSIKGIGGYFIACNAMDENAVSRLRRKKKRYGKPFAVMFSDLENLKHFAHLNESEIRSITSFRRPIVVLNEKKQLANSVSNGFLSIGAMLPYMPFHYLLFEKLTTPAIVLTSGNISEEPIAIEDDEAFENLGKVSDAVLGYNRSIYNRVDDSVAIIVNDKERLLRRSRGFVPSPIRLSLPTEGIFAAGAELVNCFAVGKGNEALLSQHIGDLKNMETYTFYKESIDRFGKLFRFKPELMACDKHPDYLSTRFAQESGLPLVEVQHHHAHITSCMAEHGLDEQVIGVSFDGTGYGDDGHIWGGEFFVCDLNGYKRKNHFEYLPIPGGDKAIKEPWRMGLSYLYRSMGERIWDIDIPLMKNRPRAEMELLVDSIAKGINAPLSSSAGRLFDAVSAIMGLVHHATFHAESPMRLEATIGEQHDNRYEYQTKSDIISFIPMIEEIVEDITGKESEAYVALKFHNTIVDVIVKTVKQLAGKYGLKKVVLSGGTFQNKFILSNTEHLLEVEGFEVFSQQKVPTNDGGIALGQMIVASKRRELKCV